MMSAGAANQITTWNKVMFAVIVILLIMVATYLLYQHYAKGVVLGQIQPLNTTDADTLKAITNYDKILRSIVDECSVKSMSMNNELTLEERIGCIDIIDKIIAGIAKLPK